MSNDERPRSGRSLLNRPYILVAAGFGLGYLARFLLGPPADESKKIDRQFDRPMPAVSPSIDLSLDRKADLEKGERAEPENSD